MRGTARGEMSFHSLPVSFRVGPSLHSPASTSPVSFCDIYTPSPPSHSLSLSAVSNHSPSLVFLFVVWLLALLGSKCGYIKMLITMGQRH